jgi:putative ABC transport system ATP-binding protein
MEPLILCENLVKIYQLDGVEVMALQGLDLNVQAGELVGVVGASGSGKSTLLNVLGGLDRPSAGKARVAGQDLLQMTGRQLDLYRRCQVGFIWQQTTRNLIPYLTALENVELPQRLVGARPDERRRRALELLEALGLDHRLHHRPVDLSGGEQQRVAIAVALANRPGLLLADEPTGELDSATAQEVYSAFKKMNALYRMTTLIVSHDPHLSRHTDRVIAIRDGKTSTETVRIGALEGSGPEKSSPGGQFDRTRSAVQPPDFEELVVLDGAGRLQLPREYLETLGIGDRVRLELVEGRIIIQPVAGRGRPAGAVPSETELVELYITEDLPPESTHTGLANWFRRILKR